MRRVARDCLALAPGLYLLICGGAAAQAAAPARSFSLEITEQLGLEIYRRDMAAAFGTDRLVEHEGDPDELGLLGWVTTEADGGFVVTFIGIEDRDFAPLFDIRPTISGPEAVAPAANRALTDEELTRFLARETALRGMSESCPASYNPVVLRHPEDDTWLVYLLAATTEAGVIQIGGHFRATVSSDGTRVVQLDRLTESCESAEAFDEDGAPLDSIMLIHEASETPVEVHAALSLVLAVDFEITTPGSGVRWKVEEGRISALE